MRKTNLALPIVALIGATRGMLGIGLGLLLSGRFKKDTRRTVGTALALAGALSTIPLAFQVLRRKQPLPAAP